MCVDDEDYTFIIYLFIWFDFLGSGGQEGDEMAPADCNTKLSIQKNEERRKRRRRRTKKKKSEE